MTVFVVSGNDAARIPLIEKLGPEPLDLAVEEGRVWGFSRVKMPGFISDDIFSAPRIPSDG